MPTNVNPYQMYTYDVTIQTYTYIQTYIQAYTYICIYSAIVPLRPEIGQWPTVIMHCCIHISCMCMYVSMRIFTYDACIAI